jgi:mannose-1-phosphate guanylyltransferase
MGGTMARVFPVVMAGGAGTRFWPASRQRRPKQLLDLCEPGTSMLKATVERVLPLASIDDVLIVTGRDIAAAVRDAMPDVPGRNVLAEPVGRNTAPCVGWAALHVRRRDPGGVMAVLPADHAVGDPEQYREVIRRALEACLDGSLCTVGITPARPETGYGYIEVGEPIAEGVHRVARFVEKPDLETARAYLAGGRHVWNSGMFFFTAEAILREVERHMPRLHEGLLEIDAAIAAGEASEAAAVERVYGAIAGESIDVGVMEKADRIRVCPGEFGWNDVGSWAAAYELRAALADDDGNVAMAELLTVGASRCLAWTDPRKVVALVGVEDLVVVDTADALLVCPRDRAQDVKKIVDEIKARGRRDLL